MGVPWNDYYSSVSNAFNSYVTARQQAQVNTQWKSANDVAAANGPYAAGWSPGKGGQMGGINNVATMAQKKAGAQKGMQDQKSTLKNIIQNDPNAFLTSFGNGGRAQQILNILDDADEGGDAGGMVALNNRGYNYGNTSGSTSFDYSPAVNINYDTDYKYDPENLFSQGKGLEGRTSGLRVGSRGFGMNEGELATGKGKVGILPDKPASDEDAPVAKAASR